MAQLSDDCFAFGGGLMSVDRALDILRERITVAVGEEKIPLRDAAGRLLAEDIVAPFNVPPHDNSAVDGYAVYFDDLNPDAQTTLAVTGRIAAGHPLGRTAMRGEALRIFTGAPMPAGQTDGGPDTVMMQEDCVVDGATIIVPPGMKRGGNRRKAGEDIREGETVLSKGMRLSPPEVGLAASVGRTDLTVYKPLKVALFSTGDEVRDPGQALPPGGIYDSNRFTLMAALCRLGCNVTDLGILRDDAAEITTAVARAAKTHDLLITSGGVSTGDEDHVKASLEAQGSLHFWRLAIKPGRPVALGVVKTASRDVPLVGLPGNPVAVMVTFLMIARPLILLMSGGMHVDPVGYRLRADFDYSKKANRREFVRARIGHDQSGAPVALKHGRSGAGVLSSLVGADGFVDLPEGLTTLQAGTMVRFLPFAEMLP